MKLKTNFRSVLAFGQDVLVSEEGIESGIRIFF